VFSHALTYGVAIETAIVRNAAARTIVFFIYDIVSPPVPQKEHDIIVGVTYGNVQRYLP
jgi:hypothetical protein